MDTFLTKLESVSKQFIGGTHFPNEFYLLKRPIIIIYNCLFLFHDILVALLLEWSVEWSVGVEWTSVGHQIEWCGFKHRLCP